ncbi:MAG TPA: hypothetical protein VK123_08395 [Candidatus Limnocylindrales bacterium]|nr:hypothetical protein [Candidatus Limnocylindrales bacterium]
MRTKRASTLAVVLLAAAYVLPAQMAPRRFPTDDSFFYLQVARNIAAGHGSTFNQVTPTNGYHPLWMGPCVLAEAIAGDDRDLALRIVFAIEAALATGAIALFLAAAGSLGIRSWLLPVPLLAAYFLTGQYGSEAHVNGFFLLASLFRLIRYLGAPSRRNALLLGLCLGLAFLARLDNVFFVAAAAVTAAWYGAPRPGGRAGALAWIAAPALALALPYLVWNHAVFGHFVPISGAIKSTFPQPRPDLRNLGTLGLMTFAGALAACAVLAHPRSPRLHRLVLGPLAAGVLAHAVYIAVFTDHHTHWSWYYVAGVILLAFLIALGADALSRRIEPRAWRVAAGAMVALLVAWGVVRGWARYQNADAASHNQLVIQLLPGTSQDRWSLQLARWMDANLPRGAGVLVFDYPGALAYYTSLRIVPADGLMGDFDFDSRLRREGLGRYLAENGIGYYLGPLPVRGAECDSAIVWTPLTKIAAGAIVRCPGDLVTTSARATRGVEEPGVALHRIRLVVPAPPGAARPQMVKYGALW